MVVALPLRRSHRWNVKSKLRPAARQNFSYPDRLFSPDSSASYLHSLEADLGTAELPSLFYISGRIVASCSAQFGDRLVGFFLRHMSSLANHPSV